MHKGHRKHHGMDLSCIPTVTDSNISCSVFQNINVIVIARYRGEKSDQGNSFSIGSERLKRKEAGSLITLHLGSTVCSPSIHCFCISHFVSLQYKRKLCDCCYFRYRQYWVYIKGGCGPPPDGLGAAVRLFGLRIGSGTCFRRGWGH